MAGRSLVAGAGHQGDGAVLLRARVCHTVGATRPVDVAFCDDDLVVVATVCPVRPFRLTRPRPKASCVIEAEAGAFARWRLQPGDRLEIKG